MRLTAACDGRDKAVGIMETDAPKIKAIVGLGNPGTEYAGTRHNVGFDLIDTLAAAHGIKLDKSLYRARFGKGVIANQRVILAKPITYMNESGVSVKQMLLKEEIALENILIVCDDIHLPVGKIRLRSKGSSGGQNGLKSIANHLTTQEWARLRIGVGEPPPGLQVDWVLGKFNKSDRTLIDETLITCMGTAEIWLTEGIETAMNRFNG